MLVSGWAGVEHTKSRGEMSREGRVEESREVDK